MGPDQPTNTPPQSPPPMAEQPPVETTPQPPQPTPPITPTSTQPAGKKSKKPLIIILVVVVIIIAVAAAYAVYAMNQKPADSVDKIGDKNQPVKDIETDNQNVNTAKDLVNEILSSETALADSDQSELANEVSSDVTNVGSSVNENSF